MGEATLIRRRSRKERVPAAWRDVRLVCFELEATKTLTQVLFFKSSGTHALLRGFGAGLSLNSTVFDRNKDLIENKVADYVAGYIRGIEL